MTIRNVAHRLFGGQRVLLFLVLCLCGLCVVESMPPVPKKKAKKKTAVRKAKPRPTDKRIYLVHADELHYDRWQNNDAQVLKGKVHFDHMGARLFCDSANFYELLRGFRSCEDVPG